MTSVVISQPMLFPWAGFFELTALADVYVHLDDVQFSKGSLVNRVQIKHSSGLKWLSVPLANKGSFQKICDLVPARDGWKPRHREFLRQAFRGAPHVDAAIDLFDRVYANERFITLLTASIEETSRTIGLTRPSRWLAASQLGIGGESWARVLAIVQAVGGTRYVTAHGAANYLDHEAFERAGVTVEYVDYSKTPYAQLHEPFTAFVSVLDVIANLGASAGAVLQPKTVPWRKFVVEKGAS
ncbi:MAG TPA: WbqC family protein [Xanthobacteraceae bacterium]|nr:WbqC family protein [Xanthobacteraceae bacterium]